MFWNLCDFTFYFCNCILHFVPPEPESIYFYIKNAGNAAKHLEDKELARIELVLPWFSKRWDEVFLKRRYRNEGRIALINRRLERLETDPFDIWSFWDFLYFSAICQTTIGFGDILPNATGIRLLVVLQIVLGYAILVVILNLVFHP